MMNPAMADTSVDPGLREAAPARTGEASAGRDDHAERSAQLEAAAEAALATFATAVASLKADLRAASDEARNDGAPPASHYEVELAVLAASDGDSQADPHDGGDPEHRQAVRLVAVDLALSGADRDDVERQLEARFGPDDHHDLLDEVFAQIPKGRT